MFVLTNPGRKRVVDASDALVLDASRSSDPDRTKETASYMWECTDEEERICMDKDENELVLPETEKVTIAGGKLKSGGKYVFKLFFVKGSFLWACQNLRSKTPF